MNEKDRSLVEFLKFEFSQEDFSDFEYLKWLQENKYNVENTKTQLRQYFRHCHSYDFSKKNKFHHILNKHWPYGFIDIPGKLEDDVDCFLYVETLGTLDGDGVLKSVPQGQVANHRFRCSDIVTSTMRKYEQETGRRVDLIYIFDLGGTKINAKTTAQLLGPYFLLIKTLLKYYAVYSAKYVVVNVPHLSSVIYNAFKPLLSEKIKKRIIILGSNWKSEIVQHVDPNILPVYYGGRLVDENNDPKCSKSIVYTTEVPSSFYWIPSKSDPKSEELTLLTVSAGTYQFVTIEIEEAGSILKWFYNADSAWGFSVFFTEDQMVSDIDCMEMVYPLNEHFSGHTRVPESDRIECKKCGYYKLWFNNSFSWFSKLQIRYQLNVIKQCKDTA